MAYYCAHNTSSKEKLVLLTEMVLVHYLSSEFCKGLQKNSLMTAEKLARAR